MKECIQAYYLQNGELKSSDTFDNKVINEGISVYEVVRLMDKELLFLEDHIQRLFSSLRLAGMNISINADEIMASLQILLSKNLVIEGNIKLVLNESSEGTQSFLVYFVRHRYPSETDYLKGVKVISYPFERSDPNKKIWRPGFRKKVAQTLERESSYEALLVDSEGFIREASKANVFVVSGNTVLTPPDKMVLPGITRSYIMKILKTLDIPVIYQKIDLNKLPDYNSMFLSGTSIKILPVSQINNIKIPFSSRILEQIIEHYDSIINEYLSMKNHI
jgi:branched-chain amino acid aminotransferase